MMKTSISELSVTERSLSTIYTLASAAQALLESGCELEVCRIDMDVLFDQIVQAAAEGLERMGTRTGASAG